MRSVGWGVFRSGWIEYSTNLDTAHEDPDVTLSPPLYLESNKVRCWTIGVVTGMVFVYVYREPAGAIQVPQTRRPQTFQLRRASYSNIENSNKDAAAG